VAATPNPGTGTAPPPQLVVLGDSVMWGQGLLDHNKFWYLVCDQLGQRYAGLTADVRAHSGAVIGRTLNPPWPLLPGEVPAGGPSILYQCAAYAGDPANVKVVLVNGGINDLDVRYILSPTTRAADLSTRIKQYCYDDMTLLLQKVAAKFSDPNCRIMLCGYYPILGRDSDQRAVPYLLKARGIPDADHLILGGAAISDPRQLAYQFWQESDQRLSAAAATVNTSAGNRIIFVKSTFKEENALFQPHEWLWNVGLDLAAEDEVVDQRTDACIRLVKNWVDCQECRRASIGHPNPYGALQYYQAIMAALP
jgi:hypothetical protein